jgi:hypothetical protein
MRSSAWLAGWHDHRSDSQATLKPSSIRRERLMTGRQRDTFEAVRGFVDTMLAFTALTEA